MRIDGMVIDMEESARKMSGALHAQEARAIVSG